LYIKIHFNNKFFKIDLQLINKRDSLPENRTKPWHQLRKSCVYVIGEQWEDYVPFNAQSECKGIRWNRPKNLFSTHVRESFPSSEVFNDALWRHEASRRGIRSTCPSANMTYARMHTRVRDYTLQYNTHVAEHHLF